MKQRLSQCLPLFLVGALVAPFGDYGHLASGTTSYLSGAFWQIFGVPAWFAALVGVGVVGTAELRLQLGPPRACVSGRRAAGAVAAVMAAYALSALFRPQPLEAVMLLLVAVATLIGCAFADAPGAMCGVAAAAGGFAVEAALVRGGVFAYAPDVGVWWGVAPWLLPLYFGFGVASAQLGELFAGPGAGAGRGAA